MNVEIFTSCDFAQDNNGKLTVIGTFDNLFVQNLPVTLPFFLALRIRFSNDEVGKHSLRIQLKGPNGIELGTVDSECMVAVAPSAYYSTLNIPLGLNNVFQNYGYHSIQLFMDDELVTTLPLNVSNVNMIQGIQIAA